MERSPLAKLPLELRLNIYEAVLHEPKPFRLSRDTTSKSRKRSKDFRQEHKNYGKLVAMTETCKQIREEAMPAFFFASTPFSSNLECGIIYAMELTALKRWLKMIGPRNAAAIRFLGVESWCWSFEELSTPSGRAWAHARKIENKVLKHTGIQLGSIHAILKVRLTRAGRWPNEFRQEYPTNEPYIRDHPGGRWCTAWPDQRFDELPLIKYVLPTRNKDLARQIVRITTDAKLALLEEHAFQHRCWLATGLDKFRERLRGVADNTLGFLQD
ncbi:hypothetical protein LTR78_000361 [Recurvomyces mirabilis]|uniref:2EXR domain-containing protein n=1 Tax=Recurvomyces mirabilis TaxID=574656 RepID=A0AAE1C6H5_9PEZI|nr:hypothetical protein LTR78_000361 [Recurvomyces mirabilis]KAK5162016.1 hypothetical protein LTS14_000362 [Recurvomyces mirabilis]